MKILQINKYLYPKGGSESYMFELSKGLELAGCNVAYWGMCDGKNAVEDIYNSFSNSIDFHFLNHFQKISNAFRIIYSADSKKKIAKVLDAFEPDLVHIHNFNFQLTPSILPEIKKRGIKIIYTAHDSQLICPYHRLYNFQRKQVCEKCSNEGFFACVKDKCFDGSFFKSCIGAIESYVYHGIDIYNKCIDVVISPSFFLAEKLKRAYNGRIEVLSNFVDIHSEQVVKKDYMLYFGRISPEKGIIPLISVFNNCKIPLKIIGAGQESGYIKNTDYIEYLGPQYNAELFDYVRKAKYVIQPSNWYENCPMTVIESLACGTPVIAPNHSGFRELIQSGYNGFLIDFESTLLSDRLKEIYNYDNLFTSNCIKTYEDKYTLKYHISKIIKIYESLLP